MDVNNLDYDMLVLASEELARARKYLLAWERAHAKMLNMFQEGGLTPEQIQTIIVGSFYD